MAAHFEVFDKLRDLGRSLDKVSSTLPPDGKAEDTNKARASLNLKALLTEAKNFKEQTKKTFADAKSRYTFDKVLAICEKQACKIREDLENLEDHLEKYGYKRPAEKLPEVCLDWSEVDDEVNDENGDQNNSPRSSLSDKENRSPNAEHGAVVGDTEFLDESTQESQPEEVDLLVTPVRPITFTKFIDPFDLKEENPNSPEEFKEPLPPNTTTPLLRSQPNGPGFNTPEPLHSPIPPTTQTPMIRPGNNFDTPANNAENSLFDDFPTPPTFVTPGLKRYGTSGAGDVNANNASCVETTTYYDPLKTPSPPSVTSVTLLRPEDLSPAETVTPAILEPSAQLEEKANKRMYRFPDINYKRFQSLPDSIQRQFSFEHINRLIGQAETYFNTRTKANSIVTDEELMSVLELGPFTRVFALSMLKLEYFTVMKSGVYSVHDKMIV